MALEALFRHFPNQIFLYKDYLFMVDQDEWIHPQNKKF